MNRTYFKSVGLSIFVFLMCISFSISAAAGGFTKEEQKCIADLHEAMDGELTASVKYADYAKQADKEKLSSIAAMFRATSRAESIHLDNHKKALADLGAPAYKPKIQKYTVKNTAANLKEVIAAEKYESAKMYPKFKYDAMVCGAEKAVTVSNMQKGQRKLMQNFTLKPLRKSLIRRNLHLSITFVQHAAECTRQDLQKSVKFAESLPLNF